MSVSFLKLGEIQTDGMQVRCRIDESAVERYMSAVTERGANLPPVVVFNDGLAYWLADGFHRLEVARRLGQKKIKAEIRDGSKDEALWYALGANAGHGLNLTREDRLKSFHLALQLHPEYSNELLAQQCGISIRSANDYEKELFSDSCKLARVERPTKRLGKDGRWYEIKNITPPMPPAPKSPKTDISVPPRPAMPKPIAPVPQVDPTPEEEAAWWEEAHPDIPSSSPQTSSSPLDDLGREIPPELLSIWNGRHEFDDLLKAISDVRCFVRNAVEAKNPLYLGVNNSALQMALDRAYGELAAARPFAVCPFCQGLAADSCRACKGIGFLGKDTYYRIVPKELQFGEH